MDVRSSAMAELFSVCLWIFFYKFVNLYTNNCFEFITFAAK